MFGICIAVSVRRSQRSFTNYKTGWVTNSKFPWMCLSKMNATVSNPSTNHLFPNTSKNQNPGCHSSKAIWLHDRKKDVPKKPQFWSGNMISISFGNRVFHMSEATYFALNWPGPEGSFFCKASPKVHHPKRCPSFFAMKKRPLGKRSYNLEGELGPALGGFHC